MSLELRGCSERNTGDGLALALSHLAPGNTGRLLWVKFLGLCPQMWCQPAPRARVRRVPHEVTPLVLLDHLPSDLGSFR